MTSTVIIRTAAEIAAAPTSVLLDTYNALTGKAITRFASREAGMRQVENAMLVAKDADGHMGVPRGADPQVRTAAELADKAAAKGVEPPDMTGGAPVFAFSTLAGQLQKAAEVKVAIQPRPKKPATAGPARRTTDYVISTGHPGRSAVRPASQRGAVLAYVLAASSPGVLAPVKIADIDAHHALNSRGYIQKLVEQDHIRYCDAQGAATQQS